jgi:hypothetical protein
MPEWRSLDQAQFRSEEDVKRDFAGAGWTLVSHEEVTWLRSANLAEDFERLKLRPVSVFEHMSAEAVEAGFARIELALPSLVDGPQYETSAAPRLPALGGAPSRLRIAEGSYSVPSACAFSLVTALRRRRQYCKNPSEGGDSTCSPRSRTCGVELASETLRSCRSMCRRQPRPCFRLDRWDLSPREPMS